MRPHAVAKGRRDAHGTKYVRTTVVPTYDALEVLHNGVQEGGYLPVMRP